MAVEITPLGFQKPDGNEPIRNGDNVIATNAQKAQELLAKHAARLANLDHAAGFTGDPLALNDAAFAEAVASGPTTSAALDAKLKDEVPPLVVDAISKDPSVAQSAATLAQIDTGLVKAEPIQADRFEWVDEAGQTLLSIEDTKGSPFFTGNPGVRTETTTRDSFEFADELGTVIFAVDGISTASPKIRSGAAKETHFIINAGQSNSEGQGAPIAAGTNETLSNLFMVPQSGAQAGLKVPAKDPIPQPYNAPPNAIGHVFTFARKYALENPDVQVVILPMAKSGTGFYLDSTGYTWASTREAETSLVNLYRQTINKCNAAIAAIGGVSKVAAILWHQGEADAVGLTTLATYKAEMTALINGFRANIAGAATAPFIIGRLGWEFMNVRKPGTYAEIDQAHAELPQSLTRTAVAAAPGAGYMKTDNTHFNAQGQKILAANMFAALPVAQYNL